MSKSLNQGQDQSLGSQVILRSKSRLVIVLHKRLLHQAYCFNDGSIYEVKIFDTFWIIPNMIEEVGLIAHQFTWIFCFRIIVLEAFADMRVYRCM